MTFELLKIHPIIIKRIKQLGFVTPTDIQKQCIPLIQEGLDVVGHSGTGSGKTAAFGLPLIEKIKQDQGIQLLVLTPTRELCVQVDDVLNSFAHALNLNIMSVYGGVAIGPQIHKLNSAEIVVGTPGRILDHIERRTINLSTVKFLVLDEADKMFEMGFVDDVERIISKIPRERQTLLFSATMSGTVNGLIKKHLKNPKIIKTDIYVDKSMLRQVYYEVTKYDKFAVLLHLLKNKTQGLALVFCATRDEVDVVTKNLRMHKVKAMAIHGGLTQNKRLQALDALKNEDISVLVATDVAARGLDIKNVSHVYNYDVSKSSEEYVHRIGRTARAGAEGDAVTLLTEKDHNNFRSVLRDRSLDIQREQKPEVEPVQFIRSASRDRDSRGGSGGFRGGQRNSGYGGSRGGSRGGYGERREGSDGERPRSGGYSHSRKPSRDGEKSHEGSGRREHN